LAESLYSRAGSQGFGISTYDAEKAGADPTENSSPAPFLYHFAESGNQTLFHRVRPVLIFNQSPFFTFSKTKAGASFGGTKNPVLFSIPMFAKYSRVNSVRELNYERFVIRMKPKYDNIEEHRKLLEEIKIDGVGYQYRYYVNYKTENRRKVE